MHTRKRVPTGIQGACGRLEGLRACYSPGARQGLGMGVQVRSPLLKVQWKEMVAELLARAMGQSPAPPPGADLGPALHARLGRWPACVCCRSRFLPGPAGVITGNMKNAPLGSLFKNTPSMDGLLTAAHRVSGVNIAIKGPGGTCQLE